MEALSPGVVLLFLGLGVIIAVLVSAGLASRRRQQMMGSEESLIPVNLASTNDAVITATVGGRVVFANDLARRWFNLDGTEPDLWLLSQRVQPAAAFLELFAAEGQATFKLRDRSIEAFSHRVAVGDTVQFVVVMREEAPLPTLAKEERGSAKALQTLAEVTRAINASLELEETLKATLSGTFRLVNFDAAQICLWDGETEVLEPVLRSGPVRYVEATHKPDQVFTVDLGYPGWIARRRQPVLIPDVTTFTEILPYTRNTDPPVRSYVGVPLVVRNRFIGALEVMSPLPETFDRDDLGILTLIAEQAAIAIENARQFSAQAERVSELSGLQEIAQAISVLQDPYKLFGQLGKRIAELMGTDMAGVLLYDRDQEKLIAQKPLHGVSDAITARYVITLEKGTPTRSLWEDVSFWFSNDISQEPLIGELGLEELSEMAGLKSTVMATMTLGEERIGVLQVSNKTNGTTFTMEDIRLLEIYARQSAIVVESARLYAEEQSRVAELQGLQQIVQAMSAVSNPEELYAQLTQRIAELVKVEVCGILIYEPDDERLVARTPFFGVMDEIVAQLSIPVGKRGLARDIWREAELFVTNTAQTDDQIDALGLRDVARGAGLKTVLLVPLSAGGRRYGFLQVSNKGDGSDFDDADRRLVSIFAGQAAALIENARLYQDTDANSRRRAAELRSVSRISHELNATLELERILEVIAVEALRAEGAKWGNLVMFEWNPDNTEIRPMMVFGAEVSEEGRLLIQAAARSSETLVIDDFDKVSHYPSPMPGARAALISPIMFEGKVVGAIGLYSDRARGLGANATEYIQALCSQATIAVTNATRHTEQVERSGLLARRADQLTQLFDLGRKFRTDQSLEGNLDSVAQAITDSVGFNTVLISSLDEKEGVLHHIAQNGLSGPAFERISSQTVAWSIIEERFDKEQLVSASYFVSRDKSRELAALLGLPKGDTRPLDFPGAWQAGDLLLVPLHSSGGQIIGLLTVDHPRDGIIPRRNSVELLEIFGNQAAIVLENSRLYQSVEERAEELQASLANLSKSYEELDNLSQEMIRKDLELSQANELLNVRAQRLLALHRVMESVDSTRGEEAVLKGIASSVVEEMEIDHCVIALSGADTTRLAVVAAEGKIPDTTNFRMLLDGDDILSRARDTATPVNYKFDVRDKSSTGKLAKALGAHALLALPLNLEAERSGVLMVGVTRRNSAFTDDDRDLFNLLASQIVVEYENARLYTAVQTEAATAAAERDRLQQLHLITTALQQANTMESRLAIIARGIKSVGWGKVAVTLLDDNLDATELITAGYEENEEKLLRKRLLPGEVWKRRLDDPQFVSLRIGSSYFLAHDHPWVLMNTEGPKRKTNPGVTPSKTNIWHPKDQLYIPMYAGSQIIGMINLRDPIVGKRPDEAGLRPLELFVQQAASALENTRLYQSTLQLQSYNEAVVQSIQQGIIVADQDGKIETFNAFLRDEYGWTEDMYGHNLADAHPSFREIGLGADVERVVKTGEQIEHLGVSFPGSGESHTVNMYTYPRLDEAQAVTGVVVLIEDVTQRARLEADIALRGEQLAALSEVSRRITAALSVGEVVSSALHESRAVIAHDRVALWLRSEDGNTLHMAAAHGYTAADVGEPEADLGHHPLFSQIESSKQPLVVADVREDSRFGAGKDRAARSWLGAPLISGGSVIGVLVMEKTEAHAYAPADGQVASAFANQVAVALENARLFEQSSERAAELDSRNQRLALLNRISATIGRSLDQNGILQTTADELAQALSAPQTSVFVYDQDNRFARLTIQSPSNPDGGVPEVVFSLDDNPAIERLREQRTPLAVDDAENDPVLETMRDVVGVRNMHSTLIIPLIIGNTTVGLITVDSTERKMRFGPEQIELAQTIINQAAVSVQNARLYEQTAARQRELTILFEAGRITSSSLDLDKIASSAAGYFIRALTVDGCGVSLFNKDEGTLTSLILFESQSGPRVLSDEDHRPNLNDYPVIASALGERGVVTLNASSTDLSNAEAAWLTRYGVKTALLVPLVSRDEAIGLVELWVRGSERRFMQRDIRLARALATAIATAMENARLLDETQKRLSELETINDLSRALTQTISTEELFQMLTDQIGQIVDTRSLTIAQRSGITGQIAFPLAVRNGLRIHVDAVDFGRDLYSHIIQTRQPLLISRDVEVRLKELGVAHIEPGLKSFLGVPLLSGEKVAGVLAVEGYEREGMFHEADLRVLNPIAAQVAVSMENARLYSELEQRLSETTTLQEVSRVVNSALNLQEIFERVVGELATAFKYPLISLYTVEGEHVQVRAYHGFKPGEIGQFETFSTTQGIVGRSVRTGRAQLVPNVASDPDYLAALDWVRSEIAIPIVSDTTVLGVLDVQAGADTLLDEGDLGLLRTFAGQVATAMVNAGLYARMVKLSEELEQRVEERTRELREEKDRIDILYKIAVELTASLDLDMVLNRALKMVGDAVGAQHGSLFLIDPQSDRLIFRAAMSESEILPPGGRQIQLSRHEGMAGWVMDQRKSIVVDNVQLDPRWVNVPGTEARRSMLGAPLVANDEVLGCIFFNSDVEGQFKETHLTLVEAAAQQVAVSINNAELYRLIRDQAERLGAMLRSQQTEAAKSQAILESVADGVMVSDQLGEIILFNAAAERILDLRRDEVLGRAAADLTGLYGKGASKWATMLREWSARPAAYAGEFLAEQIEVGNKVVSVHVSPAVHGEEFVGLVSVFRDITREVAADRIKSEFVATVSHELRTPMTSIKGYADLLLLGAAGDITPEQRRFLEVVKSNADRLSLLVNDLLDISRIEQGGVDLDIRPVDLREIVKDVVLSLEGRKENEGRIVEVKTELPAELPKIEGDYDRITQIITNLVLNGYQYTPDDGSVIIRLTPVENGVRLDVVDTGIGIPDEDQPRVFERFFRGEDPIIMRTAGTGLGLSIVQHLVNMHGGQITFTSKQGVGTTFTVQMPLKFEGS